MNDITLQYFKFVHAIGGHANDGDKLSVYFDFSDRDDLLWQMQKLGIALKTVPPDTPKPVLGKSYSFEDFSQFKSVIASFPDLEQPCYVRMAGQEMFVWVFAEQYEISIAGTETGNRYDVTEADYRACLAVEAYFEQIGFLSS